MKKVLTVLSVILAAIGVTALVLAYKESLKGKKLVTDCADEIEDEDIFDE